jgi:hypothetical protein
MRSASTASVQPTPETNVCHYTRLTCATAHCPCLVGGLPFLELTSCLEQLASPLPYGHFGRIILLKSFLKVITIFRHLLIITHFSVHDIFTLVYQFLICKPTFSYLYRTKGD